MRRFDQETAIAAIELEQMVADYWREVDRNGAAHAADYFTEDGIAVMGPYSFEGRGDVAKFYADRAETARAQFGVGNRRSVHTVLNLHIVFEDEERATVNFITVAYAGNGKLPVLNATIPVSVGEVRLECARGANGQWLIHAFHGVPLFLCDDDYVKKALLAPG